MAQESIIQKENDSLFEETSDDSKESISTKKKMIG